MLTLPRLPWVDRRPRFRSPLSGGMDTVILDRSFRSNGSVRFVDPERPGAALEPPAILAGPRHDLPRVSVAPSHAVVVLTREGEPLLTESERDRLWDAYGVPVFEQVITRDGALIAWECEAHDGFHLTLEKAPNGAECACGHAGRRVTAEYLMRAVGPPLEAHAECERLLIPT